MSILVLSTVAANVKVVTTYESYVKFILEQAMKAQRERGTVLLCL
jgi:hypothetical protein